MINDRAIYTVANATDLPIADQSVHMIATSPPYWGLRSYDTGDMKHAELGAEPLHDCLAWARGDEPCGACYVCRMRTWAAEMWRVLRNDGTLWLNLGDSYAGSGKGQMGNGAASDRRGAKQGTSVGTLSGGLTTQTPPGLKHKDLAGIPWRVALALQADGWYLRSDIIWCLSGGTYVYARTQKGDMPMTIKDLYRLDPTTVQLWNGEKWTRLLGMNKSHRTGQELEIVLRSGERISCTPTHKFPTARGLVEAVDLTIGDVLQSVRLPEPEKVRDCAIDEDAAWFAGLYLAEGSRSNDKIQISGHTKETGRLVRVLEIARKFGGSATHTIDGNKMNIRVSGKILNAIIDELVTGRTAHDKGFAPVVWRYSDSFIASMVDGYLSGDGHRDPNNDRWRLGFCRNYNLERDLRTACARLGYKLTLNLASVPYNGKRVPTYRGELRTTSSGHRNEKDRNEIMEIRKARCREVYDLGVADEPHVFALASGILTHNSKPNPMPESVKDRPTKAHEYVFLLTKNRKYFWDAEAVKEETSNAGKTVKLGAKSFSKRQAQGAGISPSGNGTKDSYTVPSGRNIRTVWTIATAPYSGAHFATWPPALVERMIKAGSRPGDVVLDPFAGSGTTLMVARRLGRIGLGFDLSETYLRENAAVRLGHDKLAAWGKVIKDDTDYGDLFRSNR